MLVQIMFKIWIYKIIGKEKYVYVKNETASEEHLLVQEFPIYLYQGT